MVKPSQNRGDAEHYRELARRSRESRIKRHLECSVVLSDGAKCPTQIRNSDAGYDIYALHSVTIAPGDLGKVETGMRCRCPEGYFYKVENRSSMHRNGLVVWQGGVIDATYTGPISVYLLNTAKENRLVEKGDKVAQLIFYPILHVRFNVKAEFSAEELADRAGAGYGSTGK